MKKVLLAYDGDNASLAAKIVQDLAPANLQWENLTADVDAPLGAFASALEMHHGPIIMLVTDNLLKDTHAMAGLYTTLQRILPVRRDIILLVAPGVHHHKETGTWEAIPTSIDRLADALRYMNYWQNGYLEAISEQQHLPAEQRSHMEEYVTSLHDVASDIGNLIDLLRHHQPIQWHDFSALDYAEAYRLLDVPQKAAEVKETVPYSQAEEPTPALADDQPALAVENGHSVVPESNIAIEDKAETIAADLEEITEDDVVPDLVISEPLTFRAVAPTGFVRFTPVDPAPVHQAATAEVPAETEVIESLFAEEQDAAEEEPVMAPTVTAIPEVEETSALDDHEEVHLLENSRAAALPPENILEETFIQSDKAGTDEPLISVETLEDADGVQESHLSQTIADARLWLEKGHLDLGKQVFELAIFQHPQDVDLRNAYTQAAEQYGFEVLPFEQANEVVAPATEAANEQPEAKSYFRMGELAFEKEDFLFAKYCWDRVAEIDPTYPSIYKKLGLLTADHLPDYGETALVYLEKALQSEPNDITVHRRLAELLEVYQPEQAQQHWQQIVDIQPDNAEARAKVGQLQESTVVAADAVVVAEQPDNKPLSEATYQSDVKSQSQRAPFEPLTVLITGATSGIGHATAEIFAAAGHRVIVTGRNESRLDALQSQLLRNYDAQVQALNFDVRHYPSVVGAIRSLPADWQQIDVLVNNAGLALGLSPLHEGDPDDWDIVLDTNVKGLLYLVRAIAPSMVARRKGHIVNVGSAVGKEVYAGGGVYCASKFAVDALTKTLRQELHPYQVRVSEVSPGHVSGTAFQETRFYGDAHRAAQVYDGFQALTPHDVAEVIYFMTTRPAHVNVQDVLLYSTQQASATVIDRSGV